MSGRTSVSGDTRNVRRGAYSDPATRSFTGCVERTAQPDAQPLPRCELAQNDGVVDRQPERVADGSPPRTSRVPRRRSGAEERDQRARQGVGGRRVDVERVDRHGSRRATDRRVDDEDHLRAVTR